jgi:hypothetical protein
MITIGFSTRKVDPDFIELLRKSCGVPNVQILPVENNGEFSLTQVYNKILGQSENDIVVLCHDDIYFDSKNWGTKVLNHFKRNDDYGILGVAGSTYLPSSGKWWEDFSKLKGIVNHESAGKKWESKYSSSLGNQLDEVLLVDGLFIVIDKNKIKTNFNEEVNGFHFYDVDFSFRNFLEGVKIGVMYDVRVTHKSIGQTNDQWEINRQIFSEQFNSVLPKKTITKIKGNPKFKVLVSEKEFNNSKFQVAFYGKYTLNGEIKKIKNRVQFYDLSNPYCYKIGDGRWGFNTPNGFIVSEVNKKYKVKEFDFNIIHNLDESMIKDLTDLYPKACMVTKKDQLEDIDNIINEYNKIING